MWIIEKIKNQFSKIEKKISSAKLRKYLRNFKAHGKNCFIQFPVCIEGREFIELGDNVSINSFVHIWGQGGITIGDDTLIASHVALVSVTHNIKAIKYRESIIEKPIHIGNNVWLGSHCVIMPGITIEDNVIVGAGSVVTKDLEKNGIYTGVPAKRTKELTQFNSNKTNYAQDI